MTKTTTESDVQRTAEDESSMQAFRTCPECDGQIVHDNEHGESNCEKCGLVVDEQQVDRGPEWRAYDAAERDEKSRIGAPTTPLIHDKGLSTTISWKNKDGYGNTIPTRKRARIERLRTWDERFRTKDAHERNLNQALTEISRMASALGLSTPPRETAGVLYRRAVKQNLLPGRSIEGMATACLYAAARQHGTPRTLSSVSEVSRVRRLRIQRAYNYLSRELGLQIEPERPSKYVPQFASKLDVSEETIREAQTLLEVATDNGIHSGKSPAGLAAAALYAASHLTNERLTQNTVSDATDVSKVTIRKRYQELLEVYGAQG